MAPHKLTILDPTSVLGKEIAEQVAAAFPHVRRELFHTAENGEHLIAEVAREASLVAPLSNPDELDGSAAVIVSARPASSAGGSLLDWLRAHPEVPLVDATQPGLAAGECCAVAGFPRSIVTGRRWYHLVDPAIAVPARLIDALSPHRPEEVHVTVIAPASSFGDGAVEELASQGVARLSGHEPRRPEVLPGVLAFDLQPVSAEQHSVLAAQLEQLYPRLELRLQALVAGTFHGHVATVLVRLAGPHREEAVRGTLRSADGLRLARRNERLAASATAGEDDVVCGELSVEGGWLSAWLVADGFRVGGAAAVIETLHAIMAS